MVNIFKPKYPINYIFRYSYDLRSRKEKVRDWVVGIWRSL